MGTGRLEVCVDSVTAALAAEAAGAERLEFCAALSEGGVTPGAGTLETVLERVRVPVVVLARPRRGDFLYDEPELAALRRDVERARAAGAAGVALGVLRRDGTVDVERTAELVHLARPLQVTFHRAFDGTRDAREALDALLALGVERVLSAGHAARALEGAEELAELVRRAGTRLSVMPGGGVRAAHAAELLRRTGASELHASAARARPSPMEHRNPALRTAAGAADEYALSGPDADEIRGLRLALDGRAGGR